MIDTITFSSGSEIKNWDFLKTIPKISELDFVPTDNYAVASREEILYPIIKDNQIIIVAGAFFGDEGKGKTVDAIARHPDVTMVARLNSGANAGHTVYVNGTKHVFHLMPSAILVDGVTNYIGSECVMDPVDFVRNEVRPLVEAGIDLTDRLAVGNVHIVTPYHKLMDILRNINVSSESELEGMILSNVSTMQGIAPAHSSKSMKEGPRLDDLFGPEDKLKKILSKDMAAYFGMLKQRNIDDALLLKICEKINSDGVKRAPDYVLDFLKADDKQQFIVDLYRKEVIEAGIFPPRKNVNDEINKRLEKGEKILLESAQSYWLSNSIDTHWGSSTSANTTAIGTLASSTINFMKYKTAVINVHKTPASSRVGRGSNPAGHVPQTFFSDIRINTLKDLGDICVDFEKIQRQYWQSIRENGVLEPTLYSDKTGTYYINAAMAIAEVRKHGETGATSKKPRVPGLFDCVLHAAVMKAQGPYTTISAIDRGDFMDHVGVVIAYCYYHPKNKTINCDGIDYENGMIIKPGDALPNERVLAYCHPIIKVIDGWKETPINADKWKPEMGLPNGVQQLIGTIEHLTGAKIISIGNGQEADNLIYLKKN